MSLPPVPWLLVIVPGERAAVPAAVLAALAPVGGALLLRAPGLPGGPLLAAARDLVARARPHGVPVLVSDRVDVAAAAGAAGVHLPAQGLDVNAARAQLGPEVLVGRSCHTAAELAAARAAGADYASLSPLFPTTSHPERPPLGETAFARAVRAAPGPVLALGGITPAGAAQALAAGASGVAVLSGVWSADEPASAVVAYGQALSAGAGHD